MADRLQELKAQALLETPYDASDPKNVEDMREKAAKALEDERRSIFELMQSPEGRKFMWGSVCCVWEGNPVVPGDSLSTYYNLGMESRARFLFKEVMKISASQFVMMIKENAGDEFNGKDMAAGVRAEMFI